MAPNAALAAEAGAELGVRGTVAEVAEVARQYKPGLRLVDDRDLPPGRLRRWVRARTAALGRTTPPQRR